MLTWKNGKIGDAEKRIILILIGVSLLLGFFSYGGEIFMRVFLFSLIPLCYFISRGSSWKIFFCFFAIFLIIATPPLYMVARYGNEVIDYVPPSEIKGIEFINKETTQGYIIGPGIRWSERVRDFRYRQSHEYIAFSNTEWKGNTLSLKWFELIHLDWPKFVCISYGIREYYDFFLGEPQFIVETSKNLSESTRYNNIYSNPSFEIYLELRH